MRFLRRIRGLPPLQVLHVFLVFVTLGAACHIGGCKKDDAPAAPADSAASNTIFRKCSECGTVLEGDRDEMMQQGLLDLEGAQLRDAGLTCPKCNKPTMKLARKCPTDATVFIPDTSQGFDDKAACCPKCGWNPYLTVNTPE